MSVKRNKGMIVWLTGFSGAGKSTLAQEVAVHLESKQLVRVLDGDDLRKGISADLGFSMKDRDENLRRTAEISRLFAESGFTVITAFISPLQKQRDLARKISKDYPFFEVFVDCPLEVCEKRDVKGLYKQARSGKISEMTGVVSPFEVPINPDLHLKTDKLTVEQCVEKILKLIQG